jgi:hypothetical protein
MNASHDIGAIARILLGEPNARLSSKTEWRYGTHGSLSIDLEKCTWFDHEAGEGGGTHALITRETGLTGKACFDWEREHGIEIDREGKKPRPNGKAPLGKIAAIYPYVDENCATVRENVRFEPKDFRQRRPARHDDPPDKVRDGYVWSTKGTRNVPYRLPELIEAIGSEYVVFCVEGERDADNLHKIGAVATCNIGGAGNWESELNEYFRDADVIVIPDNDPQAKKPKTGELRFHADGRPVLPGQDHAVDVCRNLTGIARRVRLLDLAQGWPDMPPKADVSDWLKAGGGTIEKLWDIVEKLPDWEPPAIGNGHDPEPLCSLVEVGRDDSTEPCPQQLPELIIDGGDLTATAKQLAEMFAQRRRFLSNGTEPIQIICDNDGMPRAVSVTPEVVRCFAHKICIPKKFDKKAGKIIRVTLSADVANLYLRGLIGEWGLKNFNGITTAPILSDDGSFRTGSGYDETTGLWCHNIPEVNVPEEPSAAQAEASLAALRQFFRTFSFADAETTRDRDLGVDIVDQSKPIGLDESCFLVAMMTAVCRASLTLAPGILATAPALSGAGTGKGLATKAICIIASGASPSAFTAGHDAEELDKRLTAALVEARPAIFLDNYNSKALTSDILASALTENPCEVRPLGHTAMVRLHTRTLVAMTGNAVQIAENMVRRVIVTNFDAKTENPELRPFKPGFLDTVHRERATLLGHALTIWRWGRQNPGALTPGKPLGSYETWAQWCRDPLIALGVCDPVDRLISIKAADPKRKRIQAVFDAWWQAHKDALLPVKDMAQSVLQTIDEKAGTNRDGEFKWNRQYVARWLQNHINTRVGGYVLTSTAIGTGNRPNIHYRLTMT